MKADLLNSLIDSINNTSDCEDEIYEYVNKLNAINDAIFDVLHYIENHELSRPGKIAMMDELQDLRKQRRDIKQMWEIYNTYGINRNKLVQKENREFLIHALKQKDKELNSEYRYRYYTEETLNELNIQKRGPGRPKKVELAYNNNEDENHKKVEEDNLGRLLN